MSLLSRAPLRALLAANAVSVLGSSMTLLALPWFVLATTGSAGRTGLVAACEGIGLGVSALLGSPLVNRLGARRAAVLSDVLAAAGVVAVPLLHGAGLLELWLLCVLVGLVGLVAAPGITARYVLAPRLVELGGVRVERAMSMYDGVSRGARMLGAPLAGVLIALLGPADVLVVDAVTFLVSAALIRSCVPDLAGEPPEESGYVASLRAGVSLLRADRLLLGITVMVCVTNLLDAAWAAVILPVYAREVLGSSVAMGTLVGLFGLGALTGTFLYGWAGHRLPRWPVFTAAFLVCGPPRLFGLAVDLPFGWLVALALVTGLACGAINPLLTVVELERVPDSRRAAFFGVAAAGSVAGMPLGAFLAGVVVDHLGLHPSLAIAATLYLVTTLSPVVWASTWRQMDPQPVRAPLVGATMGA